LGGFVGPFLVGVLKQQTGTYSLGMAVLAVGLLLSALIIVGLGRAVSRTTIGAAGPADA
jgi:ACS family tartrate transporter-like MFS transporter